MTPQSQRKKLKKAYTSYMKEVMLEVTGRFEIETTLLHHLGDIEEWGLISSIEMKMSDLLEREISFSREELHLTMEQIIDQMVDEFFDEEQE